jgi:hypothetical protein
MLRGKRSVCCARGEEGELERAKIRKEWGRVWWQTCARLIWVWLGCGHEANETELIGEIWEMLQTHALRKGERVHQPGREEGYLRPTRECGMSWE